MEVKEAIASRLSIRRYAESSIPHEHMETLFRALQLAPSANNGQNWEFVFVGDADLKHRLISACSNQRFVGNCTYFIAGAADPARPRREHPGGGGDPLGGDTAAARRVVEREVVDRVAQLVDAANVLRAEARIF